MDRDIERKTERRILLWIREQEQDRKLDRDRRADRRTSPGDGKS